MLEMKSALKLTAPDEISAPGGVRGSSHQLTTEGAVYSTIWRYFLSFINFIVNSNTLSVWFI
jgi:hypothetical protein